MRILLLNDLWQRVSADRKLSLVGRAGLWRKLALRYFINFSLVKKNIRILSDMDCGFIFESDPILPLKPIRPYLLSSLNVEQRADALLKHYQKAKSLFKREYFELIHHKNIEILKVQEGGDVLTVTLGQQGVFAREAELKLSVNMNGRELVGFGLTLAERPGLGLGDGDCIWVGISKGFGHGEDFRADIRLATQILGGIRPKGLLVLATRTLAECLHIHSILAVRRAGLALSAYGDRNAGFDLDYDSMWTEFGGKIISPYACELPVQRAPRDFEGMDRKKRAAVRKRNRAYDSLQAALRENIESLVLQP